MTTTACSAQLLRTMPACVNSFSTLPWPWDVVSTLNNDGSLYIIERMNRVAVASSQIRSEQMKRERDDIMTTVRNILDKEYDSDNDNDKLLHNIETASNIRWEFDTSCSADSYYFGICCRPYR